MVHPPLVASASSSKPVSYGVSWLAAAAAAQVALALYFQAVNWLPLGTWNYQPGFEPLALQAMHGRMAVGDLAYVVAFLVPVAAYILALARSWEWLIGLTVVGYTGWLVLQVVSWWIPYAFGASDSWMATYERVFSQSTQLLPSVGRHLAPDGLHIVLTALLTAVVVTTATGLVRLVLQRRRLDRGARAAR